MAALITGGGSATGTALAKFLRAANRDVLFASRFGNRIPEGFDHVKFDWIDSSTFETPFAFGRDIQYVYLLLEGSGWDPLPVVKPFVHFAAEKGPVSMSLGRGHTRRGCIMLLIALLSSQVSVLASDPWQCSWSGGHLKENFLRDVADIKQYSELRFIHAKGRVPFIGAQDVAQAAFHAITDIQSLPCSKPVLIGPGLVSYDEVQRREFSNNDILIIDIVAEGFSKSLNRTITHHIISEEDLVKRYMHRLPEEYARMMMELEKTVERGVEEVHLTDKRRWVGKIGIKEWIEAHKDAFVWYQLLCSVVVLLMLNPKAKVSQSCRRASQYMPFNSIMKSAAV